MSKLNTLLSNPTIRYGLVGGSAYILEIATILLAQHFGASSLMAVALSFGVGLIYTFTLQKFFSFRDRRTHKKIVLTQLLMVTALVLFNFAFTLAITAVLQHLLPTVVIRTAAIAATTIWNFYLYRAHIFTTTIID